MRAIARATALAALPALLLAAPTAHGQSAEEFYKNQSELKIIISSSPGGGYDTFGRLVSGYMTKYMPGNPKFVVQNMPGGGGVRAGNFIANIAPKDGTVISIINRGIPTAPLIYGEKSRAQFSGLDFNYLGSLVSEIGVALVSSRAPAQSIEEAKQKQVILGVSGIESDPAMYARLFNSLLGTKFLNLPGYKGQTEYMLAMDKGEVHGMIMSGWSGPNRLKALQKRKRGEVKFLAQMALKRDDEIGSHVPTIFEFIKSPEDEALVKVILSRLQLGRPFIAPPGVPQDRVAVLRTAFQKAVDDPELRAEMDRKNYRMSPIYGEEAQEIIKSVYQTPKETIEKIRAIASVGKGKSKK